MHKQKLKQKLMNWETQDPEFTNEEKSLAIQFKNKVKQREFEIIQGAKEYFINMNVAKGVCKHSQQMNDLVCEYLKDENIGEDIDQDLYFTMNETANKVLGLNDEL